MTQKSDLAIHVEKLLKKGKTPTEILEETTKEGIKSKTGKLPSLQLIRSTIGNLRASPLTNFKKKKRARLETIIPAPSFQKRFTVVVCDSADSVAELLRSVS